MTEQELNTACDIIWDIIEPYVNTSEDCEIIQNAFHKAMGAVIKESLTTAGNDTESRFIDKACYAYCQVCGHYPHKVPTHICRQDCDYYMRFRKAMTEKTNPLFEQCLANVDPETREEVRRNMDAALDRKGFAWHNALEELPEEEKEVIVIYDNGYLCYNHRPKKGGCFLRPDGERIPYRPIVDDAGWCDFPKQATHGHKVVLWTENPMEN